MSRLRSLVAIAVFGSLLALIAAPSASAVGPYTLVGLWPAIGPAPDYGYIPALNQWQGKHAGIVNIFSNQATESKDINGTMNDVWTTWHAIPMLSYGAPVPNSLAASGGYDMSDLQPLINNLKAFVAGPDGVFGNADDRRVYFRYAWEPDVKNMSWSPCSTNINGGGPARRLHCRVATRPQPVHGSGA